MFVLKPGASKKGSFAALKENAPFFAYNIVGFGVLRTAYLFFKSRQVTN